MPGSFIDAVHHALDKIGRWIGGGRLRQQLQDRLDASQSFLKIACRRRWSISTISAGDLPVEEHVHGTTVIITEFDFHMIPELRGDTLVAALIGLFRHTFPRGAILKQSGQRGPPTHAYTPYEGRWFC